MRIDRALTVHLFQRYRELVGSSQGHFPILMYHSVSDDPQINVSPYYRTATSPVRFSQQMQWLREWGYTGVSLEQALDAQANGESGVQLAAITFDDGYRDFHTFAWPALKRQGFTATMYLPTAFISTERKSWNGRECLQWQEVRELQKEGARFGSHTVNHRELHAISWDEIEKELRESKFQIEQELGENIPGFAYPFAFPQEDRGFTRRFTETAKACGYESCATTVIGSYQPGQDRFLLKRLPVNECDDRDLFGAKLAGAYDWMAGPQSIVRLLKSWRRRGSPGQN